MKTTRPLSIFFAGLGLVLLAGCAAHYAVTDIASGKLYYTDEIDKTESGGVEFTDAKTGKEVTIQSSEVKKIGRDDYNSGVYGAANP